MAGWGGGAGLGVGCGPFCGQQAVDGHVRALARRGGGRTGPNSATALLEMALEVLRPLSDA